MDDTIKYVSLKLKIHIRIELLEFYWSLWIVLHSNIIFNIMASKNNAPIQSTYECILI